jgi:hypothetical protein
MTDETMDPEAPDVVEGTGADELTGVDPDADEEEDE